MHIPLQSCNEWNYTKQGLSKCYSSTRQLTQLLEMTNVLFTPTWCHEMGPKAHHSHLPFLYQIGPTLHEYPGTTCTSAFREPQAVNKRLPLSGCMWLLDLEYTRTQVISNQACSWSSSGLMNLQRHIPNLPKSTNPLLIKWVHFSQTAGIYLFG
jgi:hypothetical protein